MKTKVTTCRLSDLDIERINNLKEFFAECWGITTNEISTTDIISWSIGIAHIVKIEKEIDLTKEQEVKEWK